MAIVRPNVLMKKEASRIWLRRKMKTVWDRCPAPRNGRMPEQVMCCAKTTKRYRKRTEQKPLMRMDCSVRKRQLMKQNKLVLMDGTEEHYSTMGSTQHWLDILKREGYTMFSGAHFTWPLMYTKAFSIPNFGRWFSPSQKHCRWLRLFSTCGPL